MCQKWEYEKIGNDVANIYYFHHVFMCGGVVSGSKLSENS